MEITKNSKNTDNIIAYWAVVKAYAIPQSCFCLIFWCFRDNCWQILGHSSSSQVPETCDSQTGCCCSDLIPSVECNCLLLVWIDKCFVRDVSCLYHNYRIALLQDIRSRKTPEKPDSRSARTWTSSSEWRHGKYLMAEKHCRCYILHVYLDFNFHFYLPIACAGLATMIHGKNVFLSYLCFFNLTVMNLNSSLNPLIYGWKTRHIRQAVLDTLRNICPSCPPKRE